MTGPPGLLFEDPCSTLTNKSEPTVVSLKIHFGYALNDAIIMSETL